MRPYQPREYLPTTRWQTGHSFRDSVKSALVPAGGLHCRGYQVSPVLRRGRLIVARTSSSSRCRRCGLRPEPLKGQIHQGDVARLELRRHRLAGDMEPVSLAHVRNEMQTGAHWCRMAATDSGYPTLDEWLALDQS